MVLIPLKKILVNSQVTVVAIKAERGQLHRPASLEKSSRDAWKSKVRMPARSLQEEGSTGCDQFTLNAQLLVETSQASATQWATHSA